MGKVVAPEEIIIKYGGFSVSIWKESDGFSVTVSIGSVVNLVDVEYFCEKLRAVRDKLKDGLAEKLFKELSVEVEAE